jgi:TonB family protein
MQGKVTYVAFVNGDGSLSHYTKVQSTGYPSLDDKTLNALKRWKFLRGQTGWVEIPFQWSLVGPAEELASALRRQNRATADKL